MGGFEVSQEIESSEKAPVHPYTAIFIAILFVSFASIFVRFSDAPAFIIAFYRVFLATIFLVLYKPAKVFRNIRAIDRKNLALSVTGGAFLALHFATWILSLEYTTISNSVILVNSAPLFALLLSTLFLKEGATLISIAGVIVTIIGAAVIGWGDFSADPIYFKGDLLAITGACSAAAYLVCGRVVRAKLGLREFLVLVYGFAALFLAVFCLLSGLNFFGYSGKDYLLFTGLALLPTIAGHSLFLYALRYMKAFLVNLGFLGEPIGATILAFIFFNEVPAWYFYLGGSLIILGSVLAVWRENMLKEA